MHGGPSRGPITPEGKAVVGAASAREWQTWREARGLPPDWRYGKTWLSRRQRETAAHWVEANKPTPEEETP
jgi:hypothetical protein